MRKPTRREFVQMVAAWSGWMPVTTLRQRQGTASAKRILAYVGTYSSRGGQNHGQGIHILEMNPATGGLVPKEIVRSESNPSWLTFNRTRTHLYSANELADPSTGSGSCSAYAVERDVHLAQVLVDIGQRSSAPIQLFAPF